MSTPQTEAPINVIAPIPYRIRLVDGTEHTLRVRPLNVLELYEFIEFASKDQTPDLVALVIDRPKDWLNNLDPRTYGKLAAKCIELNFPAAMELAADPIAAARLMPLVGRMRQGMAIVEMIGKDSKPSASAPPPSGSAAATGTASSETPPSASHS